MIPPRAIHGSRIVSDTLVKLTPILYHVLKVYVQNSAHILFYTGA